MKRMLKMLGECLGWESKHLGPGARIVTNYETLGQCLSSSPTKYINGSRKF